jgi:Protein of unknown function (DUF3703)
MPSKRSITGPYAARWAKSRELLELSRLAIHEGRFLEALQALDTAHNLGRDSVALHATTHLRYVRFALRDSHYKRAVGHIFWAMSSPLMVPLNRRKRTAVIGTWPPPAEKLAR